jgi:signal peptidase II
MAQRPPRDWRGTLIALSVFVLLLDRVTKKLIERYVPLDGGIPVIPHIFRISHVENAGAAFSLFGNSAAPGRVRWLLIGFSVIAAVIVLGFLIKLGRRLTPMTVALALILGGAIGNAYDRIRYGYVIDFVEVHIVHYHWPDFNVADSAIVVGGLLLVLDSLRASRNA